MLYFVIFLIFYILQYICCNIYFCSCSCAGFHNGLYSMCVGYICVRCKIYITVLNILPFHCDMCVRYKMYYENTLQPKKHIFLYTFSHFCFGDMCVRYKMYYENTLQPQKNIAVPRARLQRLHRLTLFFSSRDRSACLY